MTEQMGPQNQPSETSDAQPSQQPMGPTPPTPPPPPPSYQAPKPTQSKKKQIVIAIIAGIIVIGAVVGIVIGVSGGNGSKTGSDETKGGTTATQEQTVKESFTNDNYAMLFSNPDKYKGSKVDVVGKIFTSPEYDEGFVGFQMFADPANGEWNTIVGYYGEISVAEGDIVKVKGEVIGEFEGENAMGGTIRAVNIMATSIEPATMVDALPKAQEVATVEQAQNQHGIIVTLHSVQLAQEGTRVMVTIQNTSGANASFYDFNAKLTQGNKQYEPEYTSDSGLPSELLPGIQASGVVMFPKIDWSQGACTVYLEAGSDNYSLDFNPYVFNVTWTP